MNGHFLKNILAKVSLLVSESHTSDRELLQRFCQQRDEASFQLLLHKYGPMVWNVCRQMLPRDADAEDAFQATFLALAQQAGTIREQERLGGWLHGVAYRVAMKIRRSAATRRQREQEVSRPESHENATEPTQQVWDETLSAVHEEVNRLPTNERTAFILCYFEGLRQEEAARQLGCKLGTLSGRLCRARQRILDRLTRRGIAPSLTAATVSLSAATSTARAPLDLCVKTIFNCTNTSEMVSPLILELAKGATMIGMRTKMLAAATLVGGAMALTVGGGLMGQQFTKPASVTVPSTAAAAPAVQSPVAQSGAASAAPRLATAPASSGWEYKIVNQDINAINEESFNQLGKEGWEFCTTLSGNPGRILFKRSRTKSALASIGALDMNAPTGMGPGMTIGAGMPGGMGGGLPGGVLGMPGGGGPGLPGGVPGMPGGGGPGLPGGVPGMPGGGIVQSIPPASSAVPSGASGKTRVQTPDPRSRTGGPGAPGTASMPSSRDRNTHEEVDPEETAIIPLKHAQANDIMSTLVQLYTSGLPGMGQRFVSDHPKFAVDMRTNSLLLIGQTRQLDKIRELIKALDVEAKEPKGPTRSRIDNN